VISVVINGETREVPDGVMLDRLPEVFSLPMQRIAIEVNKAVIRRADWPFLAINEGDRIEVVYFVGGG
jgi:sulfur carrier protein